MRRKIQNLTQGKFEYDQPALIIREEELNFQVVENEIYSGSFHIESSSQVPVRGIITCENPHIKVVTTEFDALVCEILFEYDGTDVTEGDADAGCFVITGSTGEYLLDFKAKITRHYLATSIGKIKTLNDFSNLANLNWEEALKVFSSSYFTNVFHENAEYHLLLYRALTANGCSSHAMEEFLVGIGKKQRSTFALFEDEKNYQVSERVIPDSVRVIKSEWGYCDIAVSCDAPFVSLKKNRLSMYDFRGKHADVSWQIIPQLMHRGRNFAVITLENNYQKEKITITAVYKGSMTEYSRNHQKRVLYAGLERKYMQFLLEEKTSEEWKNESLKLIDHMKKNDPDNRWMDMFAAWICLKTQDKEQARERMLSLPRSARNGRTPLGAFYDYLTALEEEDYDYDMDDLARIRQIQNKYPKHPILFWVLLQTDSSLKRNPLRKYQAIRKFMTQYSRSPVLYLEAADLLISNPEILSSYGDFEFHLISWMSRKNLITYELALRIQSMVQSLKEFNRNYYRILSKCYKKYPDIGFVKVICTYLIKTSRYGEAYFPWFRRGLENHIRIAGLYEGYMLSWSRAQGELPVEILKYFSMNSSLPTQRKAMLFSYIVRNKHRLGKDWPAYMVMVKSFALQQLEKGNISEDLAIIYEELRRTMPVSEWKAVRRECENCYKIHLTGERWAAVRVHQNDAVSAQHRAILYHNQAYVYLYRKPYVIIYEDRNGMFYTAADDYRISKMLAGSNILSTAEESTEDRHHADRPSLILSEKERLKKMAGPIDEMTELLLKAQEEGENVLPSAQQLMVRMLFTGYLPPEHEKIFRILLGDRDSFELALAYATVISRSLLFGEYPMSDDVYRFLADCLAAGKKINGFCEAAFLLEQLSRNDEAAQDQAERILMNYLFESRYFDFFEKLPAQTRRRYFMTDLKVVSYHDTPGKTFYIVFSDEHKEAMTEVLPGLFTYPVRMLPGEPCSYRIVDISGMTEFSGILDPVKVPEGCEKTRYGRLSALRADDPDSNKLYEYARICDMTEALFVPIEE